MKMFKNVKTGLAYSAAELVNLTSTEASNLVPIERECQSCNIYFNEGRETEKWQCAEVAECFYRYVSSQCDGSEAERYRTIADYLLAGCTEVSDSIDACTVQMLDMMAEKFPHSKDLFAEDYAKARKLYGERTATASETRTERDKTMGNEINTPVEEHTRLPDGRFTLPAGKGNESDAISAPAANSGHELDLLMALAVAINADTVPQATIDAVFGKLTSNDWLVIKCHTKHFKDIYAPKEVSPESTEMKAVMDDCDRE